MINSLNIDNVGKSVSREVAKLVSNQEYSFSGLDRKAASGFNPGEPKRIILDRLIAAIESNNIHIVDPVPVAKDAIFFELTGSPKAFGFKTKGEFLTLASNSGFNHGKLNKDCKYLITDDLNSGSSKMKKAKKLGIEVITYEEFTTRHTN